VIPSAKIKIATINSISVNPFFILNYSVILTKPDGLTSMVFAFPFISKPYNEIHSESKQALDPPFNAYSRETRVSYVDPTSPELPEVETDSGIKKIEITIFWKSSLGITEQNIELLTLISRK